MVPIEIDLFEYSFLLEACIPPAPIARTWFWKKSVDIHYNLFTPADRERLFTWMSKNSSFKASLERGNEYCLLWRSRYDPDNQYKVHSVFNGESQTHDTFLHNGEYRISETKSVNSEYITKIEKL